MSPNPSDTQQRCNKHLTNFVFSVRTVSNRSSFFPLRFMAWALRAWAINRGGKYSVRNLQYGPQTRLVRGMERKCTSKPVQTVGSYVYNHPASNPKPRLPNFPYIPLHYQVDPPLFRKILLQRVTFLNVNDSVAPNNK